MLEFLKYRRKGKKLEITLWFTWLKTIALVLMYKRVLQLNISRSLLYLEELLTGRILVHCIDSGRAQHCSLFWLALACCFLRWDCKSPIPFHGAKLPS